jgi:hypothetical protein
VRAGGEALVRLRQGEAVRELEPEVVAGGSAQLVGLGESGQGGRHVEQVEKRISSGAGAGGQGRRRARSRRRFVAGGRAGAGLAAAFGSSRAGRLDPPERQREGFADRAVRGPLSRRLPQAPFQDLAESLVVGELEAERQRHLDRLHGRSGVFADGDRGAQRIAGRQRQRVTVGVPVGHRLPGRRGQRQLGSAEARVRRVGPRLAEMEQRSAEAQQLDGQLRRGTGRAELVGFRQLRQLRQLLRRRQRSGRRERRRDQEQVLRAEVQVRQPVAGELLQAGQRLVQQRQDAVGRGAGAARAIAGLEADALELLHHQESAAVRRQPRIHDQREVGVPQPGEPGGISAEARGDLGRQAGVRRRDVDQLDDDGLAVVDAAGAQDAAAPALDEDLLESVVVGELTRRHLASPGRTCGREPAGTPLLDRRACSERVL